MPSCGSLGAARKQPLSTYKILTLTVRTRNGNSGFHSYIKTDHFGGKDGQITLSAVQVNFLLALEEKQKCFHENGVFHQEALTAGDEGGKHFYRGYLLHTSVLTR